MEKENSVTVTANRQYKSTMFCMLFRDKKELLELYNAVNHSHYTDPEALEIVTLENAVYMSIKNDMAFLIDMHLNLYEHQSTFNPNMPLRDLLYVANEYQKLIKDASIYSSKLLKIPTPRFIVFYNGHEVRPEEEVLRLSDAYFTREENPELELKVTVLNINAGNNRELLEQCKPLQEYMQYVDCIRKYVDASGMTLEEAVEKAVNECIEKGILSDFLRRNKAEAMSISIFEYNEAEEKEKLRKAEYQGGYEEGYDSGYDSGYNNGFAAGKELSLISQVCKKLRKGMKTELIAEELEENLPRIESICKAAEKVGLESEPKEVAEMLAEFEKEEIR